MWWERVAATLRLEATGSRQGQSQTKHAAGTCAVLSLGKFWVALEKAVLQLGRLWEDDGVRNEQAIPTSFSDTFLHLCGVRFASFPSLLSTCPNSTLIRGMHRMSLLVSSMKITYSASWTAFLLQQTSHGLFRLKWSHFAGMGLSFVAISRIWTLPFLGGGRVEKVGVFIINRWKSPEHHKNSATDTIVPALCLIVRSSFGICTLSMKIWL